MVLGITASTAREIVAHLQCNPEREAVGLLLGCAEKQCCSRAVALHNSDRFRRRFLVSGGAVRTVRRIALSRQLTLLALYHSHPSGRCDPSELDKRSLRSSTIDWVIFPSFVADINGLCAGRGYRAITLESFTLTLSDS